MCTMHIHKNFSTHAKYEFSFFGSLVAAAMATYTTRSSADDDKPARRI